MYLFIYFKKSLPAGTELAKDLWMHGLPAPSAFACISFSQCPYSWQSLLGVCMLNSRQKNHCKRQHWSVCCFPQNKQLTVQVVLIISALLLKRVVRRGRYPLAASPFCILLSSVGLSHCSVQSWWSWRRGSGCSRYSYAGPV